jgi:hypothetical protein
MDEVTIVGSPEMVLVMDSRPQFVHTVQEHVVALNDAAICAHVKL